MQERRPASLGDRLNVVALVCGLATATVLLTNFLLALTSSTTSGAAPSPIRQRVIQAARPADLTLGLVVVVGAAALALGRWLDAEHQAGPSFLGSLVGLMAAAVAVLAVVGMIAELLWQLDGAIWGWRVTQIGQHSAAAALGGLAWWLARPTGRID